MDYKNQILVPIDFSNVSMKALDYATNIAQQINKKVVVVNIIKSNSTTGNKLKSSFGSSFNSNSNPIDSLFTYRLYRKNKRRLKTLNLSWNNHHVIGKTDIRMTSDGPLETIQSLVKHYEPFMLVLPYATHSKFEQYFTSNTTLDILRNVEAPTLFIPESASIKKIENIVLPSGFSEEVDLDFLNVIKRITHGFDSNLHLVKILEDQEKAIDAEIKMRDFSDKKSLQNHQINTIVAQFVDEALDVYQQSVKADLICLMTKGKSGLSQLFYSTSITETLLKKANKPILSMTTRGRTSQAEVVVKEQYSTKSFIDELTY